MLTNLKDQMTNANAKVKVGVVIFNKEANQSGFFNLTTQYDDIKNAIEQDIHSGTNTHAGLIAGEKMLDDDKSVDASRKYLIFVSDGITYMYNAKPTATAWGYYTDRTNPDGKPQYGAGPDNWYTKYGNNDAPEEWKALLAEIGGMVESQGNKYEYDYIYGSDNSATAKDKTPATKDNNIKNYANSVDVALYKTYKKYQEIASKYNTYAVAADTGSGASFKWGPSFMNYLAGGKTVSFDQIKNDILYLVDKGSYVDDYMGYVDGDYDFDFVNDASALTLKVGDVTLSAQPIDGNSYGFGNNEDGSYKYIVEYIPGDKKAEEHFRWTINTPVLNFEPVQLTYKVKLTNPKTEAGTYGNYDADGSKGYTELYTNKSATLHPVDSNGNAGKDETFGKPTVSYTVTKPDNPPTPVDPTPVDPAPITAADPPVQKVVKGDKPKDGEYPTFNFKIAPVSTTTSGLTASTMPMPAKTSLSITGPGVDEFGDITFKKTGTYVYEITESKGSEKGWDYDSAKYTVTYVVAKSADGSKLTCKRTIAKDGNAADDVIFTNVYKEPIPEPTNITIEAQKKLKGKDLKEGEFKFQLKGKDENGKPFKVTARNDEDGTITFPEIQYKKTGTYTYTVTEVSGGDKHIVYDPSTEKVKVTVTKNADGNLTAKVDYGDDGKIVFVNKYKKGSKGTKPEPTPDNKGKTGGGSGPKTGDPSNLAGYLILLAGAMCLLLAIPAYCRRKKQRVNN